MHARHRINPRRARSHDRARVGRTIARAGERTSTRERMTTAATRAGETATSSSSSAAGGASTASSLLMRYRNHEAVRSLLAGDVDEDADDDFESLDRRAREVESALADVERRSIDEHAAECENLMELGKTVEACEETLAEMESTLGTFQRDLGRISSDIRELQRASEILRVQSANRASAERALGDAIESLALEPGLIHAVFRADVGSDEFMSSLDVLGNKLDAVREMKARKASLAVNEVAPELEKLRVKAVDRTWAFLYGEFASLKKPRTNVQLAQENTLAKYAPLIAFLRERGQEVYWEVKSTYVDVVGRVLKTSLSSYLESLKIVSKQPRPRVALAAKTAKAAPASSAGDVAASAVSVLAGMFASSTVSTPASSEDGNADCDGLFVLGDRARALRAAETEPPIVVHRQSDKVKQECFDYEELFRSAHRVLIDTATFEYAFCEVFWRGERDVFESVFAAPLAAYNTFVAQGALQVAHDAVGLLVAIRVNNAHRRVMSRRRVPALDAYIDNVNMTLWPNFKSACDLHIKSLDDMQQLFEPNPESPNFIVQRYANLVGALTRVAHARLAESSDETEVVNQVDVFLDRLRQSLYECLSVKMCASLKDSPRARSAYLVKSYDYICTILSSLTDEESDGDEDERASANPSTKLASLHFFEEKLAMETKSFIAHIMVDRFARLMKLARSFDSSSAENACDAAAVRDALVEFQNTWRDALKSVHEDCLSCFTTRDWRTNDLFRRCVAELLSVYGGVAGDDEREGSVARSFGKEARDALNDVVVTTPTFSLEANRYCAKSAGGA